MTTKYAVPAGGAWNVDATWTTISGGAPNTVKPTAADDVVLNASSGNVSIDANGVCRSLDCLGYTGTLSYAGSFNIAIGDATPGANNIALRLVAGMTFAPTAAQTISFISSSTTVQTIDTGGKTVGAWTFNNVTGSWRFESNLTMSGANLGGIVLTAGTLDLNSKTYVIAFISSSNSNVRRLILGSSIISLASTTATAITTATTTNLTVDPNTAVITLIGSTGGITSGATNWNGATFVFGTSASSRTFATGGCRGMALRYVVAGSVGALVVTGAGILNSIDFSDITNARTLTLPTSSGITVLGAFNVNGTSGKLMTITGDITKPNGVVSINFVSISNSDANGGAKFFAGANSTNGGTNTGWVFTAPAGAAAAIGPVSLNRSLNRMAGSTGLDSQGAANVWAGTTGKDLLGALNWRAGTTGLGLNGVSKELARIYGGNTGLEAPGALASIP